MKSTPTQQSSNENSNDTTYDPDPFFLEEADNDQTEEVLETQNIPKFNKNRGGFSNRGRNNFQQHHRGSSKPLTKQETRLRNWQAGARGGGKGGNRGGRFGRSDARDTNQGNDRNDRSDRSNEFSQPHQNEFNQKRKYNEDETNFNSKQMRVDSRGGRGGGGGRGRSRGGGNSHEFSGRGSNNRYNQQQQQSNQPRSAWEEGGGVSALSVTEKVKQKLSGAIVAPTGKKITFD